MTAPVEPDLDLSHLLTEAPAPPGGAARALRVAHRRHVVRRVAAAGGALVAVVAVVAAVATLRSDRGDRTVRTAGEPVNSAALLSTADVANVVSEMSPAVFGNHSQTGTLRHIVLWTTPFAPESGATHQWFWHGVPDASGRPPGDRVTSVEALVLRFPSEADATAYPGAVAASLASTVQTSFAAIPGAVEITSRPPVATTQAIVFPRGRLVYAVRISARSDAHADELRRLAIRQAELAGPQAASCPISAPLTGNPDGLPAEESTTLENVQATLAQHDRNIRSDYPGVVSLSVEPRNGEVWRGRRGDFTVHRVHDYWIVVHLESPVFCPGDPAALRSYNGVPLHFVVG